MERNDAAVEELFKAWDRQIARLQARSLSASGQEADRLRAVLAELAEARETAWSRWELARVGGMWVTREDIQRFDEAMRKAAEVFARAAGESAEGPVPFGGAEPRPAAA